MSARSAIVKALVTKFKEIDGTGKYKSNVYNNCVDKHKFWDEVSDFPFICVVPGSETREYLPSGFKWGFFGVSIKVYVKDADDPTKLLEDLISDIELVLDDNGALVYDVSGKATTDINITNIVTDEGLLIPFGIGEINISVQYQVL